MKALIVLLWLLAGFLILSFAFDLMNLANTVANYAGILIIFFLAYCSYKLNFGLIIFKFKLKKKLEDDKSTSNS